MANDDEPKDGYRITGDVEHLATPSPASPDVTDGVTFSAEYGRGRAHQDRFDAGDLTVAFESGKACQRKADRAAPASPVCPRCEGDGKAHGADRPFEWSGPGTYPGPCPVCKGTRKAPASPAAGERRVVHTDDGWVVDEWTELFYPHGATWMPVATLARQADADLLCHGGPRLAALERERDEARQAIRDMLPLACCTCQKSPHGCVILSATCPFCRATVLAGGGTVTDSPGTS